MILLIGLCNPRPGPVKRDDLNVVDAQGLSDGCHRPLGLRHGHYYQGEGCRDPFTLYRHSCQVVIKTGEKIT